MATIDLTMMRREIREIPLAVQRLLSNSSKSIEDAATEARALDPNLLVTIARGSSDHCATYLKYAFEIVSGLPVASIGPSVSSIYNKRLKLNRSVTLTISQSGKSPDIVEATRMCKTSGSLALAITNHVGSQLAVVSDHVFDMASGPEKSVAATKTFVNSLVSGLYFLAKFSKDLRLEDALHRLPEQCETAIQTRWDGFLEYLKNRNSLYVLGRGPSVAIAHEMALKFKETCQIHAEAYSAAEVMHGPVSIVGQGFPILALAMHDASYNSVHQCITSLEANGARVFSNIHQEANDKFLAIPQSGHPLTEPIIAIVCFYCFVEELSRLRGNNPDLPPNLRKVTETV